MPTQKLGHRGVSVEGLILDWGLAKLFWWKIGLRKSKKHSVSASVLIFRLDREKSEARKKGKVREEFRKSLRN